MSTEKQIIILSCAIGGCVFGSSLGVIGGVIGFFIGGAIGNYASKTK